MTHHIVIVGGGIAGLSAAYRISRSRADVRITLLEAAPRLGGKILTERDGGFLIEGGPDSFLARKPAGIELCRSLGIERDLVGSIPEHRGTFVARGDELLPMPEGLSGLIPAKLDAVLGSALFTEGGKARFAAERDVPASASDSDETLETFMIRRFGREVYARLVEPLMAGIYAGDGRELSLAATFPQLRALERDHGSVLRGLGATASASGSLPAGFAFLTPRNGMAAIVTALESALARANLVTSTAVRGIARRNHRFSVELESGERVEAEGVVLAAPAHASAMLLDALDGSLAAELAGIPHVSTATVSLAFCGSTLPQPLEGYGFIIPRQEGSPLLACTYVSNKYPGRAPVDTMLIRGFVGRRGQDTMVTAPDEDLIRLVREELRRRLGISEAPSVARVFRWQDAMPQYTLGHLERLSRIDGRLADLPGLGLAGNAYRGVGIPDCIASGEAAARSVLAHVTP